MSKKHESGFLADNPAFRDAYAQRMNDRATKVLATDSGQRIGVQALKYDANEYNRLLETPSDFAGSPQDIDGRLGDRQSAFKQWANGVTRFPLVVGTKLLGSLAGMKNVVEDAANGFDGKAYVDGELTEGIQKWEESVKEFFPIYAKTGYETNGLINQLTTAKFWADEALDGLAFLASSAAITMATAGVGSVAAGALGIAGKAGAAAANASKIARLAASGAKAVGLGAFQASHEAAVEAYGSAESVKQQLEGTMNPETGDIYTPEEIKQRQAQAASSTFTANMSALMLPAMWETRIVLGLGKKAAAKGFANRAKDAVKAGKISGTELLEGVGANQLYKSGTKAFLKGAATGVAVEGLWEENIQHAIQHYDVDNAVSGKDPGLDKRTFEYASGMLENLGTTEGQKAIILGGVIGGPFGGFASRSGVKAYNKEADKFVTSLSAANKTLIDNTRSYLKTYPEDVKDASGSIIHAKGSVMLDEAGNPQVNEEAAMALTQQIMTTKRLADKHAMAALQGNDQLVKLNSDITIGSAVWNAATNKNFESPEEGVAFLKWHHEQVLREQSELADQATDESLATDESIPQGAKTEAKTAVKRATATDQAYASKIINDHLQNIDSMVKTFKEVEEKSADLNKHDQSPERSEFNHIAKKGMFYERIKQGSIRNMINDKQAELAEARRDRVDDAVKTKTEERIEKEIEGLGEALTDSMEKYNKYYEDTDEVFKVWAGPTSQITELEKQIEKKLKELEVVRSRTKQGEKPSAEDEAEGTKLHRELQTLAYTKDEILKKEGPKFKHTNGQPTNYVRESIIATEQSDRVQQPTGLRYKYFEKAASGVKALTEIQDRIEDLKQDNERITEILDTVPQNLSDVHEDTFKELNAERLLVPLVAKMAANVPILEEEMKDEVGSLIQGRREILERMVQIANEIDEENTITGGMNDNLTTAISDLLRGVNTLKSDLDGAQPQFDTAVADSISNQDLFSPEKIEDHLTETIAREYMAKGEHILSIALDENGEIREDFRDVATTESALNQVEGMFIVIQNRFETGDLQNKAQFNELLLEANVLIAELKDILEAAKLNRNNREAAQASIGVNATNMLLEVLENPSGSVAKAVDRLVDGKLNELLEEAKDVNGAQYEAVTAILNYALSKDVDSTVAQAIEEERAEIGQRIEAMLPEFGIPFGLRGVLTTPQISYSIYDAEIARQFNRVNVQRGKGSILARLLRDNDLYDFIQRIKNLPEDSDQLSAPKAEMVQLYELYKTLVTLKKIEEADEARTSGAVAEDLRRESLVDDGDFSPTVQQDMAIRDLTSWYTKEALDSNNWAYLRGVAGTGKTNIVLKWFLRVKLLGLSPDKIVSAAHTDTAANAVAKVTGTPAMNIAALQAMDLTGKRLVVIDEYGTIPTQELQSFKEKVNLHNATLKQNATPGNEVPYVKVLILGDPTQISPSVSKTDDVNTLSVLNKGARSHTVVTPLTVVYRSDVSAVNEISDRFQAEGNPVMSISARSNSEVGKSGALGVHVIDDKDMILSTVKANIEDPASTKRKRVIIVENEAAVTAYENALIAAGITPGETTVQVVTVYNAQSLTFDEVYVDIPTVRKTAAPGQKLGFTEQRDNLKFNTLMYTAISRAKEYAMVVYPESKNVLDTSLQNEKTNNAEQIKESRKAYQLRKAKEVQMLKNLQEGKPLQEGLNTIEQTITPKPTPAPTSSTTTQEEEIEEEEEGLDPEEADIATDDIEEELEEDEEPEEATPVIEGGKVDGDGDPYTGGEVIGGIAVELGDNISHIDKEGSAALKSGELKVGDEVFYVYAETPLSNKRTGVRAEPSMQIFARTESGKIIRIGQMFDKEFDAEGKKLRTRKNIEDFTKSGDVGEIEEGLVKTARITEAQHLHFKYQAGKKQSKGIHAMLMDAFSSVFEVEPMVEYKIITPALIKSMPKLKKAAAERLMGRPVAIIRQSNLTDKEDYSNAFFVEMQAQPLQETDPHIATLKEFRDAVQAVMDIAGKKGKAHRDMMGLGGSKFESIAKALRVAVEPVSIRQADPNVSTGFKFVNKVQAKEFTYEEFSNSFKERYIASLSKTDKDTVDPNSIAIPITEKEFDQMKPALQTIALNLYGYKKSKKKDEQSGEDVTYPNAVLGKGPAQKAFNALARANEYVGGVRIRSIVPVGNRKRATGKSLTSTINSYPSLELPLLRLLGELQGIKQEKNNRINRTQLKKELKKFKESNPEKSSHEILLEFTLGEIAKLPVAEQADAKASVDDIINRKITKPVTLETLGLIVDNFKDGVHSTTYERDGVLQDSYLRKPLNVSDFNAKGRDVEQNEEFFESRVTTNFESVSPTKIRVTFTASSDPDVAGVKTSDDDVTDDSTDDAIEKAKEAYRAAVKNKESAERLKELKDAWMEAMNPRQAFDVNSRPNVPDTNLTLKEAMAHVRQLIPSITEEEVEFVQKYVLDRMAKPGEDLLGLFERGKVYVALTESGTIPRSVLRHEVFHKIFNQYLTGDQRAALKREIDPQNELSYSELDEVLADKFMEWKKEPESFSETLQGIFRKLMNWLGFANKNKLTLKQLFQDIERGRFTKPVSDKVTARRAFNNIAKTFGNSMNYKAAMDLIESKLLHYRSDELDKINVYTKPELKAKIKKDLQYIKDNLEEMYDLDPSEMPEGLEVYRKLMASGVYERMWATIYRTDESGTIQLEDDLTEEEADYYLSDEYEGSFLDDLAKEAAERDEEDGSSDGVRDAVSYILYRGKPLSPRYSYAIALQIMNGLNAGTENWHQAIHSRMTVLGFKPGSKGYAVGTYLMNVFIAAELNSTHLKVDGKNVDLLLPDNEAFMNSDVYAIAADKNTIVSAVPMDGYIFQRSKSGERNGATLFLRDKGESTPNFITRIAPATFKTTMVHARDGNGKLRYGKDKKPVMVSLEEQYGAEKGVKVEEFRLKSMFRKFQKQKEAAVVYSHFASHREATFYVGDLVAQDGFDMRYRIAHLIGKEAAVRNKIRKSILDVWAGNDLYKVKEFLARPTLTYTEETEAELLSLLNLSGQRKEEFNSDAFVTMLNTVRSMSGTLEGHIEASKDKNTSDLDDSDENLFNSSKEDGVQRGVEDSNGYITFIQDYLIGDRFKQAKKYRSISGKNLYPYHLGSQGLENIQRVIDKETDESRQMSDHNIFKTGVNKMHKIVDHDGFGWKGRTHGTVYRKENEVEWMTRNFSFGFLGYMKNHIASNAYVQFLYTNSNKPSTKGVVVNVLGYKEQNAGLEAMLLRHVEADDIVDVKNYDKYNPVNNDLIVQALDEVMGTAEARKKWLKSKDEASRLKLENAYKKVSADKSYQAQIVVQAKKELSKLSDQVTDFIIKEAVKVPETLDVVVQKLSDKDAFNPAPWLADENFMVQEHAPYDYTVKKNMIDKSRFQPIVEAWVVNNYINGYFLNEVAAGDMNYFKDGLDMGKRLSSIFGMGKKGYISKHHLKPTTKVAILSDPWFTRENLSEALKGTKIDTTMKEKGFELADGQGFITPGRRDAMMLGYGGAFNGDVFKPIYSGAFWREVTLRSGDKKRVAVPTILKDSVVVLTNELVERHPKLRQLRDSMEAKGVEEVVMSSGTKEGAPITQSGDFSITDESIFEIDNDKYRLQLDPGSKAHKDKGISTPTQLMYNINVLNAITQDPKNPESAKNLEASERIYSALGQLYANGLQRFKDKMLKEDGGIKVEELANTMNPEANERVIALLENEVDINIPMLVDKVYSQIANTLTKFTTRLKFPGGKLVQQSSWGMEVKDENGNPRDLKYVEENGRLYAEVFLPIDYKSKVAVGSFLYPDAFGFRIPSTGMNSSIGLKVVGYYPNIGKKGANIIVGPSELIPQMGSDFDVDSLFVITRSLDPFGRAVGYAQNKDRKLVWDPATYRAMLAKRVAEVAGTEKEIKPKQLADIEERILINTIVENLLEIISASRNKDKITDVVSTQPIKDVLDSLGLGEEPHVDLSNPLDNMKFHQSNFQGLDLVGIFATISKSLSYMVNAGPSVKTSNFNQLQRGDKVIYKGKEYSVVEPAKDGFISLMDPDTADVVEPTQEQYEEGIGAKEGPGYPTLRKGVEIDGIYYNQFKEVTDAQQLNLWQILSALVNAAVDNVKDQLLYKMNASGTTGKFYGAALSLGIPFQDSVVLMTQPLMKIASNTKSLDKARAKLIDQLRQVNPDVYKLDAKNSDIYKYLDEIIEPLSIESLMNTKGKESLEGLTEEQLVEQFALFRQMEKLNAIGEDISKFAKMTSIIQAFPASYEELRDVEEVFDKVFEGHPSDGVVSENFSFDITNLFKIQPNIAQAYTNMKELISIVEQNIFKHSPEMDAFIREIDSEGIINLEFRNNRARLKQELMSYLTATMYSEELQSEAPYEYEGKTGDRRVATGKEAWTQRFIEEFEDQFDIGNKNEFLNKISVRRRGGLNRLTFNIDSNINSLEELVLSEGFEQIEDERLREGLVKYAVLHHGMSFGYRNFSAYIAPTAFKGISKHMKSLNDRIRETVTIPLTDEDGNSVGEQKRSPFLDKLKEHFIQSMIITNAEQLPRFPKGHKKVQQRVDPNDPLSDLKTVEIRGVAQPVYSGMDQDGYFDRAYQNSFEEVVEEDVEEDVEDAVSLNSEVEEVEEDQGKAVEDKPVQKKSRFPKFTYETYNNAVTVFMRINEATAPIVKYLRLGFQSYGGYEVPAHVIRNGYNVTDYFDVNRVPLRVQSLSDQEHEVYSSVELSVGTPVTVYNFNNGGTRDEAVHTSLKKVTYEGGSKYTVELNPGEPIHSKVFKSKVLTTEQRITEKKMRPIVESLSSRFGVTIKMVTPQEMPYGSSMDKGIYVNGTVYLNIALMTKDTAFHEVAHPIIDAIRQKNPSWYQELEQEMKSSAQGRRILAQVRNKYSELSKEEQMDEALVTLIGQMAAGRMDQVSNLSKLIRRLMRAIGTRAQSILKELGITGLEGATTEQAANLKLMDIAAVLTGDKDALNPELTLLASDGNALDTSRTELDEIEIRLFKAGRITLSCK